MIGYMISSKSNLTDNERKERINSCDVADLLAIVREYEDIPRSFTPEIIKLVASKLYDKGIMLM